ncbi:site-specific integrase [Pseudomonas moraviensis]|uniref:site-specific integrase n=1 Tax=Pseudomonas moraviensis TaxID=321662 RepID=UPI0010592E23|nr:site-specific integrase [Pseudomonas moraviensis]TDK53942.1 site-specific integrase [Pseudomonas moraviensis]
MIRRTLHSICDVPIESLIPGSSIPMLFLENGEVSLYALAWSRHQKIRQELGPQAIQKSIEAVGRFYDFYKIKEQKREFSRDEFKALVGRFMDARRHGDFTLGWSPVSKKTAFDDVQRICDFSEFVASELNNVSVTYIEKTLISNLSISEQRGIRAELVHRTKWDKLGHLFPATDLGRGIVTKNSLRPATRGGSTVLRDEMYFPPQYVLPFIRAAASTRDKLFFILMFFGSLRISEPLHLFSTDVITLRDFDSKVIIQHPFSGHFTWQDPFRGDRTGTRSEFLNERYNLGPRNRLGVKDPLHSGWKGVTFDNKKLETEIYWLTPEIGGYFAKLHKVYMQEIRRHVIDEHPYYFVNQKDSVDFGKPLKLSNINKAFYRTAEKIGLRPSQPGVNPHGARHFYGYFCASHLRLDIKVTCRMMHHASTTSTEVYYTLDKRIVHEELRKAHEKLRAELPSFFASLIADAERLAL